MERSDGAKRRSGPGGPRPGGWEERPQRAACPIPAADDGAQGATGEYARACCDVERPGSAQRGGTRSGAMRTRAHRV